MLYIYLKLLNEKELQIVEKIIAENMELTEKLNSANRKLESFANESIKATDEERTALIERVMH